MGSLRQLRETRGHSQRGLARRADVAFRTLQLLEAGRLDPRWSTLVKVARALRMEPAEIASTLSSSGGARSETARDCSRLIIRDGEGSWKIHLMDLLDDLRRDPDPKRLDDPPDPRVGARLMALIAATVWAFCGEKGLSVPWWCAAVPALDEPWFVAGSESLKAEALVESPAEFRRFNIFTLGNFMARA